MLAQTIRSISPNYMVVLEQQIGEVTADISATNVTELSVDYIDLSCTSTYLVHRPSTLP